MPLIDFKTDLKSLKYGQDRPGGGNSGQPYMQFPIDTTNIPSNIARYYELNRTSLDYPVRGGAIEALVSGQTSIISSGIDRERIQKFFKDPPRGTAFILKQQGLQLTNPRTQVPNSLQFANLSVGNAFLPVTQIYNPLNTLAQVQVQGTGAHFNRQGVGPTLIESARQTYEYYAGAPQNNTATTNRLAILKTLKIDAQSGFNTTRNAILDTGIDPSLIDRMGISPINTQILNYQGGPGSVYGIGTTRVFRYTNTEPTVNPLTQRPYSQIGLTYAQLAAQNTHVPSSPTAVRVQDFRNQTNLDAPLIPNEDYGLYNIEKPFDGVGGLGIGNPGGQLVQTSFLFTKTGAADNLNKLNPFFYDAANVDPWTAAGNDSKDIIKFAFECLSNDEPGKAVGLIFRAFLDGQITDSNNAEYNDFKYLGRGETFRTYQGFKRTVSFNFKVFAQTREEMRALYTKLNTLISQVYPDYSPQSKLMRGSVVKLTIGDYLYRVPGFLDNVNITIDNSNTPWEIQLYGPEVESDVAQLPHLVSVQCQFTPIYDFLPARVTNTRQLVPLIGNVKNNTFLQPLTNNSNTPNIEVPSEELSDYGQFSTSANPNEVGAGTPGVEPDELLTNVQQRRVAGRNNLQAKRKVAVNPFESQFERDVRTGNLFELRKSQIERGQFNVIGTAQTPSSLG